MRHDDAASIVSSATRRRYLQLTGGALASLALLPDSRAPGATDAQPSHPKSPIPFHLGLASYTLRNFDLDRALAMTHRVGLDSHLPQVDASAARFQTGRIAAATDKVKRAGLVLYGGGVISLKNERDIAQAFEYAKAAECRRSPLPQFPKSYRCSTSTSRNMMSPSRFTTTALGDRYFPTPQSVYDAVKSLDRRIGLCIDIGHTVRIGADLLGSIRNSETACSICTSRT